MTNPRTGAWLLVVIGLAALGLAQLAGPARRLPLYDGVVVEDPYRYVAPSGAQAGSPGTGELVVQVSGSSSPSLVVVTNENPPQAQLIVPAGAIALAAGTTSLNGTLTPLAPTAEQLHANAIANIYRMTVTDQSDQPVALASGMQATIILRSPFQDLQVTNARWDGSAFTVLPSITGNQVDLIRTQIDTLGDFAIVPGPSTSSGPSGLFLAGTLLLVAAIVGAMLLRRRRRSPAPAAGATTRQASRPPKSRRRSR